MSYLQDRAIRDKDATAIAIVDDTVQLWNNMWKADQIHDQTISKNVKEMQSRSLELLAQLYAGIEQLLQNGEGQLEVQQKAKVLGAAPPSSSEPRFVSLQMESSLALFFARIDSDFTGITLKESI